MVNLSTKVLKSHASVPGLLMAEIVKASRPVHWIKNLSLFAALIFTGGFFNNALFIKVFFAFVAFSLAASATYIFNDLLDAKLDRLHPLKKGRPFARGSLSIEAAAASIATLSLAATYLAFLLHPLFFFSVVGYLVLQAAYSLFLKNLATVDILVIATGFILRVYAGAFVIDAHLSVWFLLCVISLALFLASGKRRAELGAISAAAGPTRKSLTRYSKPLLDSYVTMFGNAAWMSWALFTFFESPPVRLPVWLFLAELSRTTTISKLLMVSIPVVIFGIMRYEALIFEDRSESPEKLLLTDVALIISVVVWLSLVIWILYFVSVLPPAA